MTGMSAAKDPTRNVWLQLGFADAEEHYLKPESVLRLDKAIVSLGLTQGAAARRIGATQPEPSKILIGSGKTSKAGDVTMRDARRPAA